MESKMPPLPGRRAFLKRAAGAGLAMGVGPWLASCGFSGDGSGTGATETRTYYFDLSNADPGHDFVLVAGSARHPLSRLSAEDIAAARAASPILLQQATDRITHRVAAPLPADRAQLCYVKSIARSGASAGWSMHVMFNHVPAAVSARVAQALAACGSPAASLRFGPSRVADTYSYCTDPSYDDFKDYFDHAVALVSQHPEIASFDVETLSYIQQNIICRDANVRTLALSLYQQGDASTSGGWATQVEVIDPDTGQPRRDSHGDIQYFTHYSDRTLQLTGAAIRSVLPAIKDDPVLGGDITGLAADADHPALAGKLWVVQGGTSTRAAPAASRTPVPGAEAVTWTTRDVSSGSGCRIHDVSTSGSTVSFTVSNWFVRYLGLFIRYLDGAGRPIRRTDLPLAIQQQFRGELSGDYDCFKSLVNEEFVVFGVPLAQSNQRFSVEVPQQASSLQILVGGLGTGTNRYPQTVGPGAVMTVVLDLAIPGVFLAMAATSAYKGFKTRTSAPDSKEVMVAVAQAFMLAITDSVLAGVYYDTSTFTNLAGPLMSTLYHGGSWLLTALKTSLAEGQAEGVVEDSLPFGVGVAIQAAMALGTAAEISQTSAEICNSPWTYATQVSATHDLTVTIRHDPADVQGFPATADHYRLYAVCDGSSPYDSGRIDMPATTRTDALTYVFRGLPAGGKINVSVHFYSSTGWLAGAGETGAIDNNVDAAAITIREMLVPLTAATVYGHRQKIVLDASGNHAWQAGAAPAVRTDCGNAAGGLCDLVGITLSEHFGALGYGWLASSSGVRNYANGASGQLYQFANLSFTERPQSGYRAPQGGFSTPPRLAYDRASTTSHNFYIDTSAGSSIVRRITMTAVDTPPSVDLPGSNLAVGRFRHASDGFLIHPTGKLISINTALSKIDVLEPGPPGPDAGAPLSDSHSGPGTREGLMRGPVCMALTRGGDILVLEQANNRVQAFDTGANPARIYRGRSSSYIYLRAESAGAVFLDLAVEAAGYVYVLWSRNNVYTLDVYDEQGSWVCATAGVNAGKLTIDLFRNLYTLNYEALQTAAGITEPSISQWVPSTPTPP